MPEVPRASGTGLDLLPLLEFAVFAAGADSLRLACRAPEWLEGFCSGGAEPRTRDELVEIFPYLEVFLPDADELWTARAASRLHSDIWTQSDLAGKQHRLRSTALHVEDQNLLLIEPAENLFAETQGFVQHAHDATLAYDKIAKLSRALAQANEQLDLRNREVERATQAKSEFLARMSHEIRTPMNAILGMADLLWETQLTAEQREYVRIFRRAGDNLLNLINDILDLSKVESGQMELEQVDFDLREVLEKAGEIIAVRAHAKGLELSCRIAPGVPTLLAGDPGRLRQVILNLLGNSIKFTERGELAVTVEPAPGGASPGSLLFTVRDTGIGIPADKVDTIFESFSQVDSSVTRKYGGTGLGLAISKKFVELMGGRIWVESVLGEGSAFRFTAHLAARGSAPAPPDFAGLSCLVIDDNANHRASVRDLLFAWGAVVTEAEGPDAAAKLRAGAPFAVVMVDGQMPGIDSFQLAQQLRGIAGPQAQVLLMLATNRPGDAAQCRQLGLRSLLKPVRASELLDVRRAGVTQPTAEPVAAQPQAIGPIRILLADDSEDNRFLIRSYLRNSGSTLDEAGDGQQAVDMFKNALYQLVLTDVEMPVLDGYSAARQMRAWEHERGIRATPILALTAHALTEAAQKSLDAGCNAHLTKPIKKDALVEAIRKYALREADAGPVRVVVDPSLEDIVPGYLENRRKDVALLRKALEASDFPAMRMTGHKIKGTGGGYGFPVLTEIGGAIEAAALAQDAAALREKIAALDGYLGKIEVEYR